MSCSALFTLCASSACSICVITTMEIDTADCQWNVDWLIIPAMPFISLGWVTGWPSPRRGGLWQRTQACRMRTHLTSMTLGTRWTREGGRGAARNRDKNMGGIGLAPDWFLSQFFSTCKIFQSSLSNQFCYSCRKRSLPLITSPTPFKVNRVLLPVLNGMFASLFKDSFSVLTLNYKRV